jgi:hypothetical protein
LATAAKDGTAADEELAMAEPQLATKATFELFVEKPRN